MTALGVLFTLALVLGCFHGIAMMFLVAINPSLGVKQSKGLLSFLFLD
jgi:hypothetical protein